MDIEDPPTPVFMKDMYMYTEIPVFTLTHSYTTNIVLYFESCKC